MAIEHIRFQNCDACGRRFRDSGPGISRVKQLCDDCLTREESGSPDQVEPKPVAEISEEELFVDDLAIDALDLPSVGGDDEAEGGSGPSMEEIAARTKVRRRRLHRPYQAAKRLRWPIYASFGLAAVMSAVVGVWLARNKGRELAQEDGGGPVLVSTPVLPVPGLPGYEEARELALRFVCEGELEEVLGMIRPFPGMREEVAAFLMEHPPDGGSDEMLSDMPPVVQAEIAYQSFGLLLPDGTGRLVQVVETPGGPKIDFKAYVEWCSVSREALLAGEVKQADEVRAILRSLTYYNYEFSDSERFEAFSAALMGQSEHLRVYVPRDGEIIGPLRRAVGQIGMHPATFSIRAVGESHTRRQFLLTDLKAAGFVVPDKKAAE